MSPTATVPTTNDRRNRIAAFLRSAGVVVAVALAINCGPPTGPEAVERLTVQAGGDQTAPAATAVPVQPAVLAVDKKGNPVPGVPITFTVETGGGTLAGESPTTGQNGVATLGSWTLGNGLGEQRLIAEVTGRAVSVTIKATSEVGAPASVERLAGDGQVSTAGRPVPVRPRIVVKDLGGNPVPGANVTFTVTTGGGTLEGANANTGSNGETSLLTWILGPTPGLNEVTAVSNGASTTFTAIGEAGPTSVSVAAGDGQVGRVASTLPIDPVILVSDALGNPLAGITVNFGVASGGGSISATSVVTNASGNASVQWTLGTTTVTNSIFAQVADLGIPYFFAEATAGPPATITAAYGNNQAVLAGNAVPTKPAALVSDVFSNPVPGVTVNFAVTQGGGSITGSPATTNADGIATLTGWTLGASPGTNTLQATTGALAAAEFTATGLGAGFDIELVFLSGASPTQRTAFANAVAKWQTLIAGDLANVSFALDTVNANTCTAGQPTIRDLVDDLRIYVTLEVIDGPGNVLGSAGPCLLRDTGLLPIVGSMRFDTDDLANIEANGLLEAVILHEMGHVLGIGTLWNMFSFLQDQSDGSAPFPDTHFNGPEAISAFDSIGGASYGGTKVPVEQTGGPGTRNSHWREAVFDNELMTGWVDSGTNPLSAVTTASLKDLAYVVNIGASDTFSIPFAAPAAVAGQTSGFSLNDDVRKGPIFIVNDTGRIVRIVPER